MADGQDDAAGDRFGEGPPLAREAREEALKEGRADERSRTLKNLMKNLGLSMEDALKAMGIPAEEQNRYLQTR